MSIYWNDGTELYHYGIPGQRWGERRFQNEDGTYTEEGRRRYGIGLVDPNRRELKAPFEKRRPKTPFEIRRKRIEEERGINPNIKRDRIKGEKEEQKRNDPFNFYKDKSKKDVTLEGLKNVDGKKAAAIALGVLGAAAITGAAVAVYTKDKNTERKVFDLMEELDYRRNTVNEIAAGTERSKMLKNPGVERAYQQQQIKGVNRELSTIDPKGKYRARYRAGKDRMRGIATFSPTKFYYDRFVYD